MGKQVTYAEYLNMLTERTLDNSQLLKKTVRQRRNGMEDLYGVCFSSNGDSTYPATFYISLSPDYVYLQRFAFKFVLKPYSSSVAGVSGGGSLEIDPTSLDVSGNADYVLPGTSTLGDSGPSVTPDPHTHTASGSIGGLSYGIKEIDSSSTDWTIRINGVDITPYLLEQQGVSVLFNGNGVYPSNDLEDEVENFYDILDVASVMIAEGETEKAEKLLAPGFKPIEIASTEPFGIDAYLYVKYSNLNR